MRVCVCVCMCMCVQSVVSSRYLLQWVRVMQSPQFVRCLSVETDFREPGAKPLSLNGNEIRLSLRPEVKCMCADKCSCFAFSRQHVLHSESAEGRSEAVVLPGQDGVSLGLSPQSEIFCWGLIQRRPARRADRVPLRSVRHHWWTRVTQGCVPVHCGHWCTQATEMCILGFCGPPWTQILYL